MTSPRATSVFAGFWFPPEMISLAVRYLRYGLSYQDVELPAERGVTVDHVTVYRWVQRLTQRAETGPATAEHRAELTAMPGITLDPADAAEIAETLTVLTQWLSGRQNRALADNFAAFISHPAYNTGTLCPGDSAGR